MVCSLCDGRAYGYKNGDRLLNARMLEAKSAGIKRTPNASRGSHTCLIARKAFGVRRIPPLSQFSVRHSSQQRLLQFRGRQRQREVERRPLARIAFGPNTTALALD